MIDPAAHYASEKLRDDLARMCDWLSRLEKEISDLKVEWALSRRQISTFIDNYSATMTDLQQKITQLEQGLGDQLNGKFAGEVGTVGDGGLNPIMILTGDLGEEAEMRNRAILIRQGGSVED